MMKPPRRPSTSTPHQRQLKAARNRRYYALQQQRHPRRPREIDKAHVYPLVLQDSEAADVAIDIDFEKGDAGKILRKFGHRALIAAACADIVRDKLKERRFKKKSDASD